MSSLETRKIEPATGTTVTLGAGGDTVLVSADQLKTNTVKDAGGNTLFTSNGAGTFSSVNSAIAGNMILISSQTASNSASVSFTSGLDTTYDEYMFVFVNVQPATNAAYFQFQGSSNSGSSYGVTKTTTFFSPYHTEDNALAALGYSTSHDLAQSTAAQKIAGANSNSADSALSGEFHLFAPSSTTYVKQFYSTVNYCWDYPGTGEVFVGGYFNTTSAINAFQFTFTTGNIAAGTIYLYGIS